MKILLIHSGYQQRGGEDIAFEQERHLLEHTGNRVMTYCRSNYESDQYSGLRKFTLAKQAIWSNDAEAHIAKQLRDEKPDIVHVHNTFMMISPSIYWPCQRIGIPVVQTLHNYRLCCPATNLFRNGKPCEECIDQGLWRGVSHGCYLRSRAATAAVALMLAVHRGLRTWTEMVNCYVALTDFARLTFISAGIPAEKIVIKPNFVDPDPGFGEERGDYAVFVGRLSAEKGIETLLAAWKQLPHSIPLFVIGDGPLRAYLEASDHDTGIEFQGHRSHEETVAAVKKARFLVLPSQCYENFPLSIAEAFACGTPVLCSRLGAMREIVENGRTGLHFAVGDPQDLASKAEWAWKHPGEMHQMGLQARREYETHYTAEENYSTLMNIYRRVLERS